MSRPSEECAEREFLAFIILHWHCIDNRPLVDQLVHRRFCFVASHNPTLSLSATRESRKSRTERERERREGKGVSAESNSSSRMC